MHVRSLEPTYTALAGSSPTRTTVSPGVTPRALSSATLVATSALTSSAIAVPSSRRSSADCAVWSASKVHRPRLADQHHFNLSRILKFSLDAPSDLLGHR